MVRATPALIMGILRGVGLLRPVIALLGKQYVCWVLHIVPTGDLVTYLFTIMIQSMLLQAVPPIGRRRC